MEKRLDIDAMFAGRPSSRSDDDDVEPLPENSWGTYGNFQLVGHGNVTNSKCGKFGSFYGCIRVELHNRVTLDGQNFRGKVYRRTIFHSCDKPSCPVCYKYGWAVREAGKIEMRLAEASKRFGMVEHIVATVPPKYYGLSYEALRKKINQILSVRGVIGGVMIFHGFRYNLRQEWYWSPHFHVLGFILGGYGKCRRCKKTCFKGCGGWQDRTYRAYEKDGCVVKVLGERKTVGGTAWYQLNHSSIDVTKTRFHVATWFGVCSYRKLKLTVERKKSVCPICQHDLVRVMYFGVKVFAMNRSSPEFKRDSYEDYEENGRVVWVEDTREVR